MLKPFPLANYLLCHALVTEFRQGFGLPINTIVEHTSKPLHDSLHFEELLELVDSNNLVERLDALGDLVYVIFGRIVESGIKDFEQFKTLMPEYMSWLSYINAIADHLIERHIENANQFGTEVDGHTPPIDLGKADTVFMKIFKAIHQSNMTKLCKEDETQPTQEYYFAKGIETSKTLTSVGLFAIKVVKDNSTSNLPFGKVLKNINYKSVSIPEALGAALREIESPL